MAIHARAHRRHGAAIKNRSTRLITPESVFSWGAATPEDNGVQVVSMRAHNGHFVIEIDEQRPADGGIVTQSLTSPWLVLLIDRPELPISIEPRFRALH